MKKAINDKTLTIIFDGVELGTKGQLLASMKEGLSLPDYFGMNWDALDEVLQDLSWLEGIKTVEITFTNSNMILSADTDENKAIFREIMDSAVEYWREEGKELCFCVEYK